MGNAAFFVVGHGAAKLLFGHFLVRYGFDNVRTGDKHVRRVAGHKNKIGDGRGINRAACARSHNRANLRDHAAGQSVAEENIGIARKRHHSFLNSRATGIIQANNRCAGAHRQIHNFRDLRGVRFGERASENRKILREDIHEAAFDAAVAGDEAVARRPLRFHAEIVGMMADEFVELFKGAFIKQQVDAFAGAELALLVLASAALRSAPRFGFGVKLA